MFRAFKKVFSSTIYLLTTLLVAGIVYIIFIIFPNFSFLGSVFISSASAVKKATILFSLIGGAGTSNSALSVFIVMAISILFAINLAMLVFVAQKNRATVIADKKKNVLGMLGGSVLGILGIGCGACGSLILTPLAISIGATGFLAAFPFGGSEFGFLGIALFTFSIYSLSKKINDPLICPPA